MIQQKENIIEQDLLNHGEINQLLGSGPSKLVSRGNTLLIVLISSLGFLAWYIKIPEVVDGITTLKALQPAEIITSSEGLKVKKLFKQNGNMVKPGDLLFSTVKSDQVRSNQEGRLLYLKQLKPGDTVKKGLQMMSILPLNQEIEVSTLVPISNYNKVKLGQKAIITLSGESFGGLEKLTGRVEGLRIPEEHDKFGSVSIKLDAQISNAISAKVQILYPVQGYTSIEYSESSLIDRLFRK